MNLFKSSTHTHVCKYTVNEIVGIASQIVSQIGHFCWTNLIIILIFFLNLKVAKPPRRLRFKANLSRERSVVESAIKTRRVN